jgi:tRNA pseudouridine13 synthase
MYVHAYQSYVWNCIVSERIKSFGRVPIAGDIVYDDDDDVDDCPAFKEDSRGADNEAVQITRPDGEDNNVATDSPTGQG